MERGYGNDDVDALRRRYVCNFHKKIDAIEHRSETKLYYLGYELFPKPPSSPNLAPSDFLSPSLEKRLIRKRCELNGNVASEILLYGVHRKAATPPDY